MHVTPTVKRMVWVHDVVQPNTVKQDGDRKEKRRRAIMDAAFTLFLECGYANVSMSDVIRRSGGSLATAYELFENKAGLLRAIVAERCMHNNAEIGALTEAEGPPETVLRDLAAHLMSLVLDPQSVGLLRIIVGESLRDPSFGNYFDRSGPEQSRAKLALLFDRWNMNGALCVDDPVQAAETFLALLLHRVHVHSLCGVVDPMSADEIDSHVDQAIRTICCRYAAGQNATRRTMHRQDA